MICDVLNKSLIGAKPLRIMFEKVYGFIRDCNGTKYSVLFASEKYDTIFDRIRYLRIKKQYYIFFADNYAKVKIDSDDDLPLEKKH